MKASESLQLERVCILLSVAAFLLFLPTYFHGFFADDEVYLAFKNTLLRETGWGEGWRLLFTRANPWEYLPLRDLSYWLDFRLYGIEGPGFHVTQLLWYAGVSAAGWSLLKELVILCRPDLGKQANTLAWCGTALFLVHPAHVEVVAWVASRKDLMSTFFAFLSCLVLLKSLRRDWHLGGVMLAAVLLLMACFSKAAAVSFVLFELALIMACWRQSGHVPLIKKCAPVGGLVAVAALSVSVHIAVGATTGIGLENTPGLFALIERASRIQAGLLHLLFWPDSLGLYHDVYAQGAWHWWVSLLALTLVLAAAVQMWLRPTLWACGVLLLWAPLLTYLQFVPFTTWSLASERFVFAAVAGLSLVFMACVARVRLSTSLALLLCVFCLCAVQVNSRVANWELNGELRQREFDRQPNYHNAIRDRVMYTLLPEERYSEAKALIQGLRRDYARALMLAFIHLDEVYKAAEKKQQGRSPISARDSVTGCRELSLVEVRLGEARAAMRAEPDLSINNLLTSVDRELTQRFSSLRAQCRNSGQ